MQLISYICFNFIFYSFLGWIIEEIYCYYIKKTFKKPNFLTIPLKPMYGISMTMLVTVNEMLKVDILALLLLCFIIPTSVEYASGYLLKNIFNEVYWNYSKVKHNLKGYICLKFSFYWLILSFIGVYFFQPIVNNVYISILSNSFICALIIMNFIVTLDFSLKLKKIVNNQ